MNYMPKLFVANGVSQDDFITAAGKDAEYAVGMSLYEPSLPSEGNKEFVEDAIGRNTIRTPAIMRRSDSSPARCSKPR